MNRHPQEAKAAEHAEERWELADLAAQTQRPHGLTRLSRISGRPKGTLRRWARVAREFPEGTRKVQGLTFSHFEAVVGHPDRLELIRRAGKGGWTVQRLKAEAGAPATKPSPIEGAIQFLQELKGQGPGLDPEVRERAAVLADLAQLVARGGPGCAA